MTSTTSSSISKSSSMSSTTNPYICWFSHCSCTINQFTSFSHHHKSSSSWRKDFKNQEKLQQEEHRKLLNKISGYGCNSSQMFTHFVWIVAAKVNNYRTIHEVCRKFLYGSRRGPLFSTMLSRQGFAADTLPLLQLAEWSAKSGIFIHPEIEFIRGASEYRDYRLKAKSGALLQYLTPLIIIPANCLIGFTDPEDEVEKKDMMKGTASAAGVAVENKMEEEKAKQDAGSSSSVLEAAQDVCKFFFDSLSLLANDCISAQNNSTSDARHLFASILISGTRTLKNAPYLSDKDFSLVAHSCPLAEAFRHMVHNFVDSGPLSMKVEKSLLQTAVSLALSHSTVLPMCVQRPVDNYGNLIRGEEYEEYSENNNNDNRNRLDGGEDSSLMRTKTTKITQSPGGLGIVPWLHMLPHGGSILNAVPISVSSQDALSVAKWIHSQNPQCGLFCPASSSSETNHMTLKPQYRNGFVFLVTCEEIGPDEEICSQMMAPLNPIRIAPSSSKKDDDTQKNNTNEKHEMNLQEEEERKREELLHQQFEMDKEYDETLAMWMVTTASAPSDEEALPSSEAKFIQSCIVEAIENEVKKN